MTARGTISYVDYDRETSTSSFRGVPITGANYDAILADFDALVAAIDLVCLATISGSAFVSRDENTGDPKPSDPFAQRETKWSLSMTDTQLGTVTTVEIPGADLAQLATDSNELDLTSGNGLTLKTAVEAFHRSPAGNLVTLDKVVHVGRNI